MPYSSVHPLGLTTSQHNSIARQISFRKSNLIALQEENLSTTANKIVVVNEKISKERLSLAKIKGKAIATSAGSLTASLTIKKKQFWINKLNERRQRLVSKHAKLSAMIKAGKHSMVFGGAALLRQRENVGANSSKHKDVAQWRNEWSKRDCRWIFEGDKSSNFANTEIQWDENTQMLRIRLTNEAHRKKVEVLARGHGLSTEEYEKCRKHDLERNGCRFLFIPLSFNGKGQARKLALFLDALTPIAHPSKQGKVIYREPIKWEVWIDGDKAYARAVWISVPRPQHSWLSNGSLGVDINAWGVSWSTCCPSGNKLMTHEKWFGDIPVAWRQSRNQSLHAIREAAKKIVDLALARAVPLALENLDFAQKRDSLRYGNSKYSKMLSSFAYRALREAIQARAQKSGIDVLLVNPSWTSVVGWAKYNRLGLSVDQSAAFAIARRAVLSRDNKARKDIHQIKIKGSLTKVHSRPEKISGRLAAALVKGYQDKQQQEVQLGAGAIAVPPQSEVVVKSSKRQSTFLGMLRLEPVLSSALGRDRKLWVEKLNAVLSPKKVRNDFERQNPAPPTATRVRSNRARDESPQQFGKSHTVNDSRRASFSTRAKHCKTDDIHENPAITLSEGRSRRSQPRHSIAAMKNVE